MPHVREHSSKDCKTYGATEVQMIPQSPPGLNASSYPAPALSRQNAFGHSSLSTASLPSEISSMINEPPSNETSLVSSLAGRTPEDGDVLVDGACEFTSRIETWLRRAAEKFRHPLHSLLWPLGTTLLNTTEKQSCTLRPRMGSRSKGHSRSARSGTPSWLLLNQWTKATKSSSRMQALS